MKRKNLIAVLTAILVLALALSACGSEKAPEEATAAVSADASAVTDTVVSQPLTLTSWNLTASTWSSPNGATIHISATPNYYEEGQKADFVVRLESDDVAVVPCQWDGSSYNASADLNAANGYCYYVVLTAADGTPAEVAVNTPAAPTHEAFIDIEAALESYCSVIVEESAFDSGKLTLTSGKVQVKTPLITNDGKEITCKEAVLVLSLNGEKLNQEELTLTQTDTRGLFEAALNDIVFDIPEMSGDQKVELYLNVTLTNDQVLSAYGGNWIYDEAGLLPVLG